MLYANGVLLGGGPFRPYSDSECAQLVRDLLDGYFPSELQERYPNGIPLAVSPLSLFFQFFVTSHILYYV